MFGWKKSFYRIRSNYRTVHVSFSKLLEGAVEYLPDKGTL